MKYIKFYNGEENGIIIENSTYNDSIFKDQYKQALDLFQEIMDNPLTNISKLAHIRMDFAGIMQTIGIKGRYVGFTYIRPLYGFAPFWRS